MTRLGMCSNNLNYLQNKTSRLYHIRRTYRKYIDEARIYFVDFKPLEHFYFYSLHFLYVRRIWRSRDVLFCK